MEPGAITRYEILLLQKDLIKITDFNLIALGKGLVVFMLCLAHLHKLSYKVMHTHA